MPKTKKATQFTKNGNYRKMYERSRNLVHDLRQVILSLKKDNTIYRGQIRELEKSEDDKIKELREALNTANTRANTLEQHWLVRLAVRLFKL